MNERIGELFRQAREEVNSSHGLSDAFNGIVMEKFAELIIQECIAKCEIVVDGGCGSAEDCVEEIKQHFGIEQ